MADDTEIFNWTPFYQELADKLAEYRNRQPELISILETLRGNNLKITPLEDKDETGRRFLLKEIDPFTFYGTFNRGTTNDARIAILRELKSIFEISAAVPSDFSGIPILNNLKSWYFAYAFVRKTTDVPRLWDVFETALNLTPLQDKEFAQSFDAALEIRNTNRNLTMGLFWIRPYTFLSFDKTNSEYLKIKIPKEGLSFDFYRTTLERIRAELKDDFPHISRLAWLSGNEPVGASTVIPQITTVALNQDAEYWLVGAYWDDQETPDQTERFLSEGIWENGYKDRYLDQVRSIKVGDHIAIKAMFTQKHDLPFDNSGKTISGMTIKATGTIVKNVGDGRTVEVDWDQPQEPRNWYFYTYQRTIWHLKKEDDTAHRLIRFVFYGESQDYVFFVQNFLNLEIVPNGGATPYSVADMQADGVFLSEEEIEQALNRWRKKKNLILQGAPGVGKTFVARKLAYALLTEQDRSRMVTIQFHPSFAYEDFVRGYRPTEQAAKFDLIDGPLLQVCKQADDDPDRDYVILIDEINRANLAQVFGELLMLLEADKRGAEHAVTPIYRRHEDERFHVPDNLFFIGTMNIADRSLALVDYALRRRFAFLTLEPRYADPAFRNWLQERGMNSLLTAKIVNRLTALNTKISEDSLLGPAYQVGHSFFCPLGTDFSHLDDQWYREVIQTEIKPLLLEYWYDAPQKAEAATTDLLV
jgi:5-methylcytosine-specific restriction protein B